MGALVRSSATGSDTFPIPVAAPAELVRDTKYVIYYL